MGWLERQSVSPEKLTSRRALGLKDGRSEGTISAWVKWAWIALTWTARSFDCGAERGRKAKEIKRQVVNMR